MVSDATGGSMVSTVDDGLNPCFSGRWSLTDDSLTMNVARYKVLILVLVEDGL